MLVMDSIRYSATVAVTREEATVDEAEANIAAVAVTVEMAEDVVAATGAPVVLLVAVARKSTRKFIPRKRI